MSTPSVQSSTQANDATMTLVGCLINESDYRRAHELGKGGLDGLRTGHDFVLVDAGPASTQSASSGSCTEKGTGKAYRLAGNEEGKMKSLVGRYVEITGRFEHGHDEAIAEGEKQAHLPAEIVVASFREVTMTSPEPAPSAAAPVPAPVPEPAAPSVTTEPAPAAPVATTGTLPSTASAEPLIAMIALFCLGAAFALRFVRRRAL